jgi:hypothetical protein
MCHGLMSPTCAMLLDGSVKWIGIVYEATAGAVERFTVTPYVHDPTKAPIV